MATSLNKAYEFLNHGKEIISKNYPYLIDESNDFKITRSEPGFNIPVKKSDFSDLMNLLNKTNEEKKLGFFIDLSHKSPYSNNQFIKTQFKNIPPHVDIKLAKNIFNSFGEIYDLHHKDGIWTVLYTKINWSLPYAHHQHQKTGSKERWFSLGNIVLCSFSSKIPCSKCHIKGHTKQNCPGAPLLEKLGIESLNNKDPPKDTPIKSKPKKKDLVSLDSSSDLDVSSISLNETNKQPTNTKNKPATKNNKVNTPKKENQKSQRKSEKKDTPKKKKDKK